MQTIGLNQMLAHIERQNADGIPHEFQVTFVRGTKKLKGSYKTVKKARKLGHGLGHNHVERGTIPLFDVALDRPFSPFIDNILYYNGLKVMH